MIDNTDNKFIAVVNMRVYKVEHWDLTRVLDCINNERLSYAWLDFTEEDWVQGWKDYVQPEGRYSINPKHLRTDYFSCNRNYYLGESAA
ncbi:hypothetical protein AB4254_08210 [Vibrio breoganii]